MQVGICLVRMLARVEADLTGRVADGVVVSPLLSYSQMLFPYL